MQPPDSSSISTSGSSKTWTWKLSPTLAPKSQKNLKNVSKWTPKKLPKWILKSIKMDSWTSRCLVGVPLESWITKMVTQDTKIAPPGLQINSFCINFSTHPVTSCLLPQGAGGRGEALRSAAARSNLRANAGVLDIRYSGPTTHSSDS